MYLDLSSDSVVPSAPPSRDVRRPSYAGSVCSVYSSKDIPKGIGAETFVWASSINDSFSRFEKVLSFKSLL